MEQYQQTLITSPSCHYLLPAPYYFPWKHYGIYGLMSMMIVSLSLSPWWKDQYNNLYHQIAVQQAIDEHHEENAVSPTILHGAAPIEAPQSTIKRENDKNPTTVQGAFLTATSVKRDDFLEETMESVKNSGMSAIVFDVKGSRVLYDSNASMANELRLVLGMYNLKDVIHKAHEKGLYTIGRFVAIKDAGLTQKKRSTLIQHPVSKQPIGYEWVDPSNETAIAYNAEIICELAASGIDEVNLDYIRFSTAEFGALHSYTPEEKSKRVYTFIQAMRQTISYCGPETKLGISTFAILGWNYEQNVATLGQDVKNIAPLVDIISPMAYPATFAMNAYYRPGIDPGSRMYYLVYRTLTGYQELLGYEHAKKLRPWIQGYGITEKNIRDQIQAVHDAGIQGFQVWNADNAYDILYRVMRSKKEAVAMENRIE